MQFRTSNIAEKIIIIANTSVHEKGAYSGELEGPPWGTSSSEEGREEDEGSEVVFEDSCGLS